MFCENCGNELNDGAVFCPKCGFRIEEDVSQGNTTPQTLNTGNQVLPKQGNVTFVGSKWIGVCFLLLTILEYAYLCLMAKGSYEMGHYEIMSGEFIPTFDQLVESTSIWVLLLPIVNTLFAVSLLIKNKKIYIIAVGYGIILSILLLAGYIQFMIKYPSDFYYMLHQPSLFLGLILYDVFMIILFCLLFYLLKAKTKVSFCSANLIVAAHYIYTIVRDASSQDWWEYTSRYQLRIIAFVVIVIASVIALYSTLIWSVYKWRFPSKKTQKAGS